MQEGGRSDLKRRRRQGQSGGHPIHGGAGYRGGTVASDPGCSEEAEMRRDRHGIAWPPRRIGAAPRQRNSKSTHSFQAAGDRRPLNLISDRHPPNLIILAPSLPALVIRSLIFGTSDSVHERFT